MPGLIGKKSAEAEALVKQVLPTPVEEHNAYDDVPLAADHSQWRVCFQTPAAATPVAGETSVEISLVAPGIQCPAAAGAPLKPPKGSSPATPPVPSMVPGPPKPKPAPPPSGAASPATAGTSTGTTTASPATIDDLPALKHGDSLQLAWAGFGASRIRLRPVAGTRTVLVLRVLLMSEPPVRRARASISIEALWSASSSCPQ